MAVFRAGGRGGGRWLPLAASAIRSPPNAIVKIMPLLFLTISSVGERDLGTTSKEGDGLISTKAPFPQVPFTGNLEMQFRRS